MGGYLDLLQQHPDLEPSNRALLLEQAGVNQRELVELVNRVLDAVRVVGETPAVHGETLQLETTVREILSAQDPRQLECYRFRLEIDGGVAVRADRQFLSQVLGNLLGNVFKYVPEQTEVLIEARRPRASGPVLLSVQDRGPGLPADELPLLFEKFIRLQRDLAGPVSGTGLGLYISRRLMEAMGGCIWAESEGRAGEGSRFVLALPPG